MPNATARQRRRYASVPTVRQSMQWDDEDASTLYYDRTSRSQPPPLHRVDPLLDRALPALPGERLLAPSASSWNVEPAPNPLASFGGLDYGARSASRSSKVWVWIAACCLVAAGLVVRDSLSMGSLPFAVETSPGPGGLSVPGRPVAQPAVVQPSQPSQASQPSQPSTELSLSSVPAGAAIFVDDARANQTTPVRLTGLTPGEHRIRLEHGSGYHVWEKSVVIPRNQRVDLPVARLVPLHNTPTSHKSASDSQQEVDAQPMPAATPESAPPHELPAVSAGENGVLRINSLPWAEIVIDGRKVGNTPQLNLSLAAGRHSVKLINKELGMQRGFYVDMAPGQVVTKSIVFEQP